MSTHRLLSTFVTVKSLACPAERWRCAVAVEFIGVAVNCGKCLTLDRLQNSTMVVDKSWQKQKAKEYSRDLFDLQCDSQAYPRFYSGWDSQGRIWNFPKGAKPGIWGRKSPSGVQGQSPARGCERQSPQKLERKCEIMCNFWRFSCTKFMI